MMAHDLSPGNNLDPILAQKMFLLSFFWNLVILTFDIPNNIVFAEILGLSNTFGFSSGKLSPKMD